MTKVWDTIVIGGGQAGLASGYHLKKKGLKFLILEANNQAIGSWPNYYDSLKLFSPSHLSSLPGLKMPGKKNHYPLKNEVISYLEEYTKKFQFPIETNKRVLDVMKHRKGFIIHTQTGETYQTRTIINATGYFQNPYMPEIMGIDIFKGEVLHSSTYQKPDHYKGKRVVVVGRGNSAVQIAIELAEASHTSLAVLQPVKFVNQKVLGIDMHFWLRVTGLDTFPFWKFGKKVPIPSAVADLGDYKAKLEAGKPEQQQMFTAFHSDGVIWSDGTKESVDTVIFATGYLPTLTYLNNIGALDTDGKPLLVAGISTTVPGIYFVGLEGQRSFASATLRGVGPDAHYVVRKLIQYLKM
ncbi:flavin-containing monooxygenase (plasmid) [Metabacillus halosaccharovorans]|uniref:flavin-containing monooxygenase n=1 Tax=Metabacillus halosaccharovorans TaxID=930124 RepID=UPI0020404773|nr:NAD(P)/FAD-dependent oxidoreductase [Metabacillus halosaccharovorans]MCM3441321.1 NAD(P)/FAD-dependent oxidoreductase [Metabacillus halosaccharovorans]